MNGFISIVFLAAVLGVGVQAASVASPTCGGTTSSKDIKLVKPKNAPRECEYHINAYSKYVCQVRIDFAMTLEQPVLQTQPETGLMTAECLEDYFEVNGLRLCGVETWQHIYVPLNATAGASRVDLRIVLAHRAGGSDLVEPEWDMVVTQLECPAGAAIRELSELDAAQPEDRASSFNDGHLVAPPGCLQYFPGDKGVVKSFNFNDGKGNYPSDLNYAICFKRTSAKSALNIRSYYFHLGADLAATTLLTDDSCYRSSSSDVLKADFLMIPQAELVETHSRATYLCGVSNKDVVIRSNNPGPLMVLFNSYELYQPASTGFAFTYTVA